MNLGVQILIAIFTIMASGVIAAIVSHRLNESKDERAIKMQKLEELFIHAERFCNAVFRVSATCLSVMANKITYNDMLDIQIDADNSADIGHYGKCIMIVKFYHNEIQSAWDLVISCRDEINTIQAEFRCEYEKAGNTVEYPQYRRKYRDALNAFSKAEEGLMSKIIESVQ